MDMDRFVVIQHQEEWIVTYPNRDLVSFQTREEAEHSAFSAADLLASTGHAVSVLILPDGADALSDYNLVDGIPSLPY